jgi:hypothetical protein
MTGFVSTMGALSLGMLPGMTPGLALTAGMNLDALRVSVLGTQYLQSTAQRDDSAGYLNVDLVSADLRIGWRLEPGPRWEFVPTASVEVGQFSGSGQDVEIQQTPRFAWAAGGLGGTLGFRLARRWLVDGEADVLVPFQRTQFTLNHVTFHQPAQVEGVFRLGIVYEFGKRP